MIKSILSLFVFLSCSIGMASKPLPEIDLKDRCKKTKARAILPTLESGIRFKPDFKDLQDGLSKMDIPQFCECIYPKLESVFGKDKLQKMAQYSYASMTSAVELARNNQEQEKIYFTCFGQQISRPDLAPATKDEIILQRSPKRRHQ